MRPSRPAFGYLLVVAAATMWALNGNLARYLFDDDLAPLRLAQLRSTVSLLILLVALILVRPRLLRVSRRQLPALALLGVAGLAMVHATYFIAIEHLQIGVAITIQYLAPVLLLLWLALRHGRRLPLGLWGAVSLSAVGCFLVVRAYDAGSIDATGLVAAFGAAVSFAIWMVAAERAGHEHEPVTTLVWGFGFATLFWAAVQPWWSFPFEDYRSAEHIALALGVILVGTLFPFGAMVVALRHVPAARAAPASTLEPVLAAVFAWFLHDEVLSVAQVLGGALVLAAVVWIQARPGDPEAEAAPVAHA
jgi:drug/metabolite transporter (DMT)-like permease